MTDPVELAMARRKNNVLVAINVPRHRRALERELHHTKWFDYRFMTPLEATYEFAREYREAYRRAWRTMMSSSEASKKRALHPSVWKPGSKQFADLWAARQVADAVGAPYALFISKAIDFQTDIGWKRIPQPNQLAAGASREATVASIREHLKAHVEEFGLTGKLPHYHNENYVGLPSQVAHRQHMMEMIQGTARRAFAIRLAFRERFLPVEQLRSEFGEELVDRLVKDVVDQTPLPPLTEEELRPSCFGIPGVMNASSSKCLSCPLAPACGAEGTLIEEVLIRHAGTIDPPLKRRRELDRDRQRKRRARQKASAAHTLTTGTQVPIPRG